MAKTCPSCGAENQNTQSICSKCGTLLSITVQSDVVQAFIICTSCGKENSAILSYCSSCGQPLRGQIIQKNPVAQTPIKQSKSAKPKKKFRWWKLFTWPFICMGKLFVSCCSCCCGAFFEGDGEIISPRSDD